jgi:hypothetical protein
VTVPIFSSMEYILAIQLLCGCFAAFAARRKGRSAVAWFAIGALLPVLGIVLALRAGRPRAPRRAAPNGSREADAALRPPRRCEGTYIADCLGCPFFSRPLFDETYEGPNKGYCRRFRRVLSDEKGKKGSTVVFEE